VTKENAPSSTTKPPRRTAPWPSVGRRVALPWSRPAPRPTRPIPRCPSPRFPEPLPEPPIPESLASGRAAPW